MCINGRRKMIQVYSTPAHAWNKAFFKICVLGCGRILRVNACTVDKTRLDIVRVLVSTPCLKVVKMCSDILIDGNKYSIRLVEEWGCNLGEYSFLMEEEIEPMLEALFNNEASMFDEVQAEVEALVNDLNDVWCHTHA